MDEGYKDYSKKRLQGGFSEISSFHLIYPFLENKRILDIGCSNGLYLKYFKNSIGIEQVKELAEDAIGNGLNVINSDIFEGIQQFADNSFEGVFFSHVMEHIDNPISSLRNMHRILKNDGIIVLGLPIERNIFRDILNMDYFNGTHLYSFSVRNAKKLLSLTGYTPIEIVYHLPFKRNIGLRINRIWNWIYFPKKEYFSMAYWIVAKKR